MILEIIAVKCPQCEQMVATGDDHPCWQNCQHCPPDDVYPVNSGYFVKGIPACEWCAYTEEISQAYMAGEIQPLGPADIGKLVSDHVDEDGLDQLGQSLWDEVQALERLDQFLDGDREVAE
jgi:hypothetical protein